MRAVLRALVVLASMLLVVIGAAAVQRTDTVEVPNVPDPSSARPPPPPPPPPPAPPVGPPVLAVKVDNVPAARPPTGVGAADLVYVEPVEGGASRLIAVFASDVPPVVGPVRSARETDLALLPQFGHPALAFSGAAPELLPAIGDAPLHDASPASVPSAYFRDSARSSPHNLYVRTGRLPPGDGWSPAAPLVFGPPPAGGTPTSGEEVRYSSARIGFDWSPETGRWLVSMDGSPYSAAGTGRLGAGTVVIQEVPVRDSALSDSLGNVTPYAETVGSGRATVLRDGRAFEAVWSRPDPEVGTTYTTPEGDPLPFAPGQVWTVLAPA
ncbi:DUF3048 domain-containing protein [Parasphingorhabdus pacifica]